MCHVENRSERLERGGYAPKIRRRALLLCASVGSETSESELRVTQKDSRLSDWIDKSNFLALVMLHALSVYRDRAGRLTVTHIPELDRPVHTTR